MRRIDADKLGEVKFHSLPYTHITPSDVEAESYKRGWNDAIDSIIENAPTIEPEIVRCKDCKHWRQQTNYQGAPLSFGFCESDGMWRSLYGETCEVSHIDTDDDHYCGYAERRADDQSKR